MAKLDVDSYEDKVRRARESASAREKYRWYGTGEGGVARQELSDLLSWFFNETAQGQYVKKELSRIHKKLRVDTVHIDEAHAEIIS